MINYHQGDWVGGGGVVIWDLGVAGYIYFLTEPKLKRGGDLKKAFDTELVLDINTQ